VKIRHSPAYCNWGFPQKSERQPRGFITSAEMGGKVIDLKIPSFFKRGDFLSLFGDATVIIKLGLGECLLS
jgi:hypothetical protein